MFACAAKAAGGACNVTGDCAANMLCSAADVSSQVCTCKGDHVTKADGACGKLL